MKLMLFALVFAAFEIQDNLAKTMKINQDCWDDNKCNLDKQCGQAGKCIQAAGERCGLDGKCVPIPLNGVYPSLPG